jgi:hypothetical protein
MPIVWEHLDGSVSVTILAEDWLADQRRPGETTAEAVLRLAKIIQERTPHLAGAVPTLVRAKDLPSDRRDRHRWRLRGTRVEVAP